MKLYLLHLLLAISWIKQLDGLAIIHPPNGVTVRWALLSNVGVRNRKILHYSTWELYQSVKCFQPRPSPSKNGCLFISSREDSVETEDGAEDDESTFDAEKSDEKLSGLSSSTVRRISKTTSSSSSKKVPPVVSNMSDLERQLKQFQSKLPSPGQSWTSSPPSSSVSNGNNAPDDDMAEWRELQRQIEYEDMLLQQEREKLSLPSIIAQSRERGSEEKAVLDALSSPGGETLGDTFAPSLSGDEINYDEVNLPPGAIPSQYQKKYITNFEITDDGGVYLPPETYQQACESATNPDGSLNFTPKNQGRGFVPEARSIFSPSVLETITARPMAPYNNTSSVATNDVQTQQDITIEDLAKQARKAREYLKQNPNAQEELHQRIMAEEGDIESSIDSSKLFEEALLDPEKAREFWNQEFFEKRREASQALEKLLDEKLQMLQTMAAEAEIAKQQQQQEEEEQSQNEQSQELSSIQAKSELQNSDDVNEKDDYLGGEFSPSNEQGEFRKQEEQDRLQHARNIARIYNYENDGWDLEIQEDEVEVSNQEVLSNGISGWKQDENVTYTSDEIEDKGEWIVMEDPSMSDDPFYWNTVTEEMRWDPPMG
jgi:hypothetical protein